MLIPGCGADYEVRAFHEAGDHVTAIDFSPAAVEQAKKQLGGLGERVILGDFFVHDFGRLWCYVRSMDRFRLHAARSL